MKKFLPRTFHNPLSLIGAALFLFNIGLIVFLTIVQMLVKHPSPHADMVLSLFRCFHPDPYLSRHLCQPGFDPDHDIRDGSLRVGKEEVPEMDRRSGEPCPKALGADRSFEIEFWDLFGV